MGSLTPWSPALLKMELDRWLWKYDDHLTVKKLWEYLATYCYLPRLRDSDVLTEAIREGTGSQDYFGYASSVDDAGKYRGLFFGREARQVHLDGQAVLVKPEVAQRQLEEKQRAKDTAVKGDGPTFTGGPTDTPPPTPGEQPQPEPDPEPAQPQRFFGVIELDAERMGSKAGQVAEEIVQHLALLEGANVRITLEIEAEVPDGVPDGVIRTVTENCRTPKFREQGFEEK